MLLRYLRSLTNIPNKLTLVVSNIHRRARQDIGWTNENWIPNAVRKLLLLTKRLETTPPRPLDPKTIDQPAEIRPAFRTIYAVTRAPDSACVRRSRSCHTL